MEPTKIAFIEDFLVSLRVALEAEDCALINSLTNILGELSFDLYCRQHSKKTLDENIEWPAYIIPK